MDSESLGVQRDPGGIAAQSQIPSTGRGGVATREGVRKRRIGATGQSGLLLFTCVFCLLLFRTTKGSVD